MIEALQKGDEVVTAGGMLGRITKIGEQYVTRRDRANTEISVQKRGGADAAAQGHAEDSLQYDRAAAATVNRFPTWKYALIALVDRSPRFLYTLPNFFGESPAVQVSSAQVDRQGRCRAHRARSRRRCKTGEHPLHRHACSTQTGVRVRFADTDTQLQGEGRHRPRAQPRPERPDLHRSRSTCCRRRRNWLTAIHALPMYLGLDLRGGVHFLLQVDMQAALTKRVENLAGDLRSAAAREEHPPRRHHARRPDDPRALPRALRCASRRAQYILEQHPRPRASTERDDGQDLLLVGTLKPEVAEARPGDGAAAEHHARCTTASTSSASPSR